MPSLTFEFNLLPWQALARLLKVVKKFKYNVWNCGIGTGKTAFGAACMLEDFYNLESGFAWWVCPENFQIERFQGDFEPRARRLGWTVRAHPYLKITNHHGAVLYGITAKNLNKIAAYHPKIIYVDECAKLPKTAWDLIRIRMVHASIVVLMSTPRPNHWKKVVQDGRRQRDGKWCAVEVTTAEAGLVEASVIAEMKRDLPDDLFQQEFNARFVKGAGAVFRKVDQAAKGGEPEDPIEGEEYLVTQDVAKHDDAGTIEVWKGWQLVRAILMQGAEYRAQAERGAEVAEEYNHAKWIYDQTGVGESFGEMAEEEGRERGLDPEGLVFTAKNKPVLVNAAIKGFEDGRFELIDPKHGEPYDTFVEQLIAFQRKRSGNGLHYEYSAPEGEHDDLVTGILLRVSVDVTADAVAGYYEYLAKRKEREATGGEEPEEERKTAKPKQ